jgi:hypothetical protein
MVHRVHVGNNVDEAAQRIAPSCAALLQSSSTLGALADMWAPLWDFAKLGIHTPIQTRPIDVL